MTAPPLPRPGTTQDARGREVRVLDLDSAPVARRGHDGMLPQECLRIMRAQAPLLKISTTASIIVGMIMSIVLVAMAALMPLPGWAAATIMGLIAIGWAWIMVRHKSRRLAHVLAQAYLDEGRCPSCAYDLLCLSQDPDGCTLCPECGAAWRLDKQA